MRSVAAALVVVLLAAGCSSDPVVADDDVEAALDQPYSQPDATPLDDELDTTLLTGESVAAMALCMEAAGFVGFAEPTEVDQATGGVTDEVTVEQYAREWGYGISTVLAADGTRRSDAPAFASPVDGAEGWADYRAALDPDRQTDFDLALYGDGGSPGCVAEALSTAGGSPEDQRELDSLLRELSADIDADPDVAEAGDRYATCMDDAGYPDIETPADALGEVGRRTEDVFGAGALDPALGVDTLPDGQSPIPGIDDAAAGGTEAPIETVPVTVGQIEPGALAAVQEFERDMAVAELECRVRFEIEIAVVTERYESVFVEEHRELLDRVG